MKQLHLFDTEPDLLPKQTLESHSFTVFVDGASRNNPGDAGAGIYIEKDGYPLEKRGFYLGVKTNNQAEYMALLLGIFFVKKHLTAHDSLSIVSDSELLVKQIKGLYRVKQAELQQLFFMAKQMLQSVPYSISHVLRENNIQADAMANYGIEKKLFPPQEFLGLLKYYDIKW